MSAQRADEEAERWNQLVWNMEGGPFRIFQRGWNGPSVLIRDYQFISGCNKLLGQYLDSDRIFIELSAHGGRIATACGLVVHCGDKHGPTDSYGSGIFLCKSCMDKNEYEYNDDAMEADIKKARKEIA
jgi:hypothetical protein